MMKKIQYLIAGLFCVTSLMAAKKTGYSPLDPADPVAYFGDHIIYNNEKINLGPRAFFIDGRLGNDEVSSHPYVYNSVNEAVKDLSDGSEEDPMVMYIAPWVYWIDDPDDPEIRLPEKVGGSPFGLIIDCEWLRFQGLNKNPQNVVLACNRGQTMGSKGNFTMMKITGDGTAAENLTFGNYCNIDLVYPLEPTLEREKRGSAIVQAQLVYLQGDKITARNTHFISRLNLLPFYGGKRTLFHQCHFESTDDALAPRGVYLDCSFEFYSSKPFGHTAGTGAVFLDCDILSLTRGEQYLIKGSGQMAVVDSRMNGENATYWGWKQEPGTDARYYHFNNYFNGKPVEIGLHHPVATVNMRNKRLLEAYRFEIDSQVVYNTYNLLKGDDDWDPMGIKALVEKAEQALGRPLTGLPVQLLIAGSSDRIETGKDTLTLLPSLLRSGVYPAEMEKIGWSVAPEHKGMVKLLPRDDGSCSVIPTNTGDESVEPGILVSTPDGLQASRTIRVSPAFLDPPPFISAPKIINEDGTLSVDYELDMSYRDQSLVSWYRCSDAEGNEPVKVAVSRFGDPLLTYPLSRDDIGHHMMVSVSPAHQRCLPGEAVSFVMKKKIRTKDVKGNGKLYRVNLASMPTGNQSEILRGFWTMDSYKPEDTNEYRDWAPDNSRDPWYFGPGINGASGDTGLVQAVKGARLRYTPLEEAYGDMKLSFTACPSKTAGQGFSSAKAQYMDIFIKMETGKLDGYALRLFRTTKYHNAIDCMFVKYENGQATPISVPVSTSCYRTPCHISLEARGNRLIAHMESPAEYFREPGRPEVKDQVDMEVEIESNAYGGTGFQHTGSVGSGATLIKDLVIEWK